MKSIKMVKLLYAQKKNTYIDLQNVLLSFVVTLPLSVFLVVFQKNTPNFLIGGQAGGNYEKNFSRSWKQGIIIREDGFIT